MKITLCGSVSRFRDLYHDFNSGLTLAGHVIYSCTQLGVDAPLEEEHKRRLDMIHLNKIVESDAIAVLNPGDYVGESTHREIDWALLLGKEVFYLETGGNSSLHPIWMMHCPWYDPHSLGDMVDDGHLPILKKYRPTATPYRRSEKKWSDGKWTRAEPGSEQ